MKKGFVHTSNFRLLTDAQSQVERRGAAEAGLVIVKGRFGIGKSELMERFALDTGAIFVRAKETWTKRALVDELATVLGLDTRGRNSEVQARVIARQAVDMAAIVIDEADFLVRGTVGRSSPAMLEVVRDISDVTGCIVYLVGMESFGDKLARHGHIASRVNRVVDLQPLNLADMKATCDKLCEVKLGPGVAEIILEQSGGRMRNALNAISVIEQLAEANGLDKINAEDLKGRALVAEFRSGVVGRRGGAQ